jgi:hypothetical protein
VPMKTLLAALILLVTPAFAADPPAFHGMAIFGKAHVYVSHLPMFHRPHDYQAIAEVSLGQAQSIYVRDAGAHPNETLYTIAPETNFVLPQVFRAQGKFPVTLFRGHFERGGTPIAEHVTVEIKKVLYLAKFDPAAKAPSQASYLALGAPGELFLVHQIVAAPDFDQIVSVSGVARTVSLVKVGSAPLKTGDRVGGLVVRQSLYLEFDDLK